MTYPNITYKRGCNPCNKKGKEYPGINYKPSLLREQEREQKVLEVGNCLQDNFGDKQISQILKVETFSQIPFYKVREFATGKSEFVRWDYIPYSYKVVGCPSSATFPPKPTLKIGDCAQWSYTRKGKTIIDQGTIVKIDGDDVTLETQREIMGVKGLSFHDIYELSPCPKSNPATYSKVSYSPSLLRERVAPVTPEVAKEKLYQRGADGYPIGADKILRDAYGPIPNPDQPFWRRTGFVKPTKIYGWQWSADYRQWRAYVKFPDGTETWTSPREQTTTYPSVSYRPPPTGVKISPLKENVWLVNGQQIRDRLDVDFVLGGHDLRYSFIPAGEIWVDEAAKPEERECLVAHEIEERRLMAGGMEYGKAHEAANVVEAECRRKYPEISYSTLKEKPSWRPEVEGHYRCTKCDWEGYLTWREFLNILKTGCPKCGATVAQPEPSYLKESEIPDLVKRGIFELKTYGKVSDYYRASQQEKQTVDDWLVRIKHRLAYEPGTMERRYLAIVKELSVKEPVVDNVEVYTSEILPSEVAQATGLHRDPKVEYRYTAYYLGPDLKFFQRDLEKLLRERTGVPYLVVDAYYIPEKPSYLKEARPTGADFSIGEMIYSVDAPGEIQGKVIGYTKTAGQISYIIELPSGEKATVMRYQARPKISYLKEAIPETECQIIPPEYYDLLGWLDASVPDYSFFIKPGAGDRKLTETLQKLKEGVARIHESALFHDFLLTMSKFHYYSISNQMLIALQRPTATRVAGYVTWQDLGRQVKAGEKGIAILAPCLPPRLLKCPLCEKVFTERELKKHLVEMHQREDVSILVREAREEAIGVPTPKSFEVVHVFDIAQTEGKPLPEVVVPVLTGAYSEDLYNRLMGLAAKHSVTVSFDPKPGLDPSIKGTMIGKSIWVKPDEPEAQRLKTLGHELAHYFTEAVFAIPRVDAEVIAESVAFVICAHFGFDTGTRSFPYVALWAKDKKVLEQNSASIRKISGRIIDEVEK